MDSSSEYATTQIQTTLDVLEALGVKDTPMIFVYNKIDKDRYAFLQPEKPYVYISVKEEINLDELEDMIVEMLFKDLESIELYIPYSDGSVYSELKQKYEMLDEQYLDNGIYLSLFISQKDKHKFKKYIYRNVN